MHSVAATVVEALPASQAVQAVDEALLVNVPAEHGVHAPSALPLNVVPLASHGSNGIFYGANDRAKPYTEAFGTWSGGTAALMLATGTALNLFNLFDDDSDS